MTPPLPDKTERAVWYLPVPGQTMISKSGKEWTVLRCWEQGGQRGVILRGPGGRSTITRRVDIPNDWRLRMPDREQGEWAACPSCGARFGGVENCPYDDARLIPLDLTVRVDD